MAEANGATTRANGGWDAPPRRHPAVQVLLGVAIAVALVGGMIWLIVYTGDNADRIPPPGADGGEVDESPRPDFMD